MRHVAVACALCVLTLSLTAARAASRPAELIATWSRLNSQCRGGSGDDPSTMRACEQRDAVGRRIDRAGWCYGKTGQSGYQYQWHACTANSLHPSS